MFLILAFNQINSGVSGGEDWPIKIAITTGIWIGFYLLTSFSYFRTVYLFSNAYILALAVFHLGVVYMLAFGSMGETNWTMGDFSKWLELGGWYIVLTFGSLGIGIAIAALFKSPIRVLPGYRAAYNRNTNRFLYQQGIGLLLVSFVFMILAIKSYGNILAYSRQDLFGQGPDSRGLRVFMMVFPSALILLVISAQSNKQRIFGYSLGAFGVIFFMLSGYRSAALFPLLIGAVLWVKSGRKIPLLVASGSVVAILVAISIVGIFRQMGSYGDLGVEQLENAYEKSSIERSIAEMGGTLGVLAHTLRLVPKVDNYRNGSSYWLAFKGMFPNIGFSLDTSSSRVELAKKARMDKKLFAKLSPSSWLTYRIKNAQFEKGGGVGFSAIAEPYLNFGEPGILVIFIFLGYFLARLDQIDLIAHKYTNLFASAMLWPLIRTVRNDFANFLKPLGFIIIILVIWNIALELLGRRVK